MHCRDSEGEGVGAGGSQVGAPVELRGGREVTATRAAAPVAASYQGSLIRCGGRVVTVG